MTEQLKPTPESAVPDSPPRALPAVHVTRPPIAGLSRTSELNPHGTSTRPRPYLIVIGLQRCLARPSALPLHDASCDLVRCDHALEFAPDDEQLACELARIVRPGGTLQLRVPSVGPFAVFDAFNLYRYLGEFAKRAGRPRETADVGWRRHYRVADLEHLLAPAFRISRVRGSELAIAESLTFLAMVLFRWLLPNRHRYDRATRRIERLRRVEQRLSPRQSGFFLEIWATRVVDPCKADRS